MKIFNYICEKNYEFRRNKKIKTITTKNLEMEEKLLSWWFYLTIDKNTKHYALNDPNDKKHVVSWHLVSINNDKKFGDIHTDFVEKSLEIIDFLLEEINKLKQE